MQRDAISAMNHSVHTVVDSTRDSIVYFTKDNIKNLFFEQETILWQAYSVGGITFYPTCVFEPGG